MKNETKFRSYFHLSLVVALASLAYSQVPVAIAPSPHPQFLTSSGLPLSGGFLYTYIAGTTTLSNTYADSTGTVQNPDPIPLDVSGAPSNGTAQTGIWLSNQAFKFCAFNSSMVQQWCTDNITSYFQLLNFANTWTFPQTFTSTITDTLTDNQIILGALGVQTTLDFPPPAGPVTLHFPNTADTMIGRATTDTLSKKTFSDYPTVGGGLNVATVLCQSNVPQTFTGNVTLHSVFTCTIPANVLGLSRMVRVTVPMSVVTAAGSQPGLQLRVGGVTFVAGAALNSGPFNQNGVFYSVLGGNSGATNAQTWDINVVSPWELGAGGAVYHSTSALDTTLPQTLEVMYQAGNNADNVTFFRFLVELL